MEKYSGAGLEYIECIVDMEEFLEGAEDLNSIAEMDYFVSCITEFFQDNGKETKGFMWDIIRFFQGKGINPFIRFADDVGGLILPEKYLIEYLEYEGTENAKKTVEAIKQSKKPVFINFEF